MNKRKILFPSLIVVHLFFLVGCSTAWVKQQATNGGVIGYRGHLTSEKFASLVQCPDSFRVVDDSLRSSTDVTTSYQTVQTRSNASGFVGDDYVHLSGTQNQVVPVQNTNTTYWREATYVCDQTTTRSTASSPVVEPQSKVQPSPGGDPCKDSAFAHLPACK